MCNLLQQWSGSHFTGTYEMIPLTNRGAPALGKFCTYKHFDKRSTRHPTATVTGAISNGQGSFRTQTRGDEDSDPVCAYSSSLK